MSYRTNESEAYAQPKAVSNAYNKAGRDHIAQASRRISINEILSKNDAAEEAKTVDMKRFRDERRQSQMMRMGITEDVRALLFSSSLAQTSADFEKNAVEKLQDIFTAAKEKGVSAEKLFNYFGPSENKYISFENFEDGLRRISLSTEFFLTESELEELKVKFCRNESSQEIEFSNLMEFCMAIPTLPWKAEKARRLHNYFGGDLLADAARNSERRKSLLKGIDIGEKIHDGKKLLWRAHKNLDVVIHENKKEGILIVSTRLYEDGTVFSPIFIETSKASVTKLQLNKLVDAKIAARPELAQKMLDSKERAELHETTRKEALIEFVVSRLQLPDDRSNVSSIDTCKVAESSAEKTPFLQPLSTDDSDFNPICNGLRLSEPYCFPELNKTNPAQFRKASVNFQKLTGEMSGLIKTAEEKAEATTNTMNKARKLSAYVRIESK